MKNVFISKKFFFFNTELKIDKTSKIKKSYNRKIMKNIDNIILNHKTKEQNYKFENEISRIEFTYKSIETN